VASRAAPFGFLVALAAGCAATYSCPDNCPDNQPAIFDLSCGPANLARVDLSGACGVADAGPSSYLVGPTSSSLAVRSPGPGNCKVTLTFATGFTYSADVTFVSQTETEPPGCHGCSPYTAPAKATYVVDVPSTSCVDAGLDAASDAPSDAAEGARGER
jgi:hypothetical protein